MWLKGQQSGMTLIEVMVALLVFAIGILGVAILQLSALKYSDSASRRTQVNFIAQDLMERIRANPDAGYALASLEQAPASGNLDVARDQDLFDFADQLRRMAGSDVQASVAITGPRATITLDWDDSRAMGESAQTQTLTLTSLIKPVLGEHP